MNQSHINIIFSGIYHQDQNPNHDHDHDDNNHVRSGYNHGMDIHIFHNCYNRNGKKVRNYCNRNVRSGNQDRFRTNNGTGTTPSLQGPSQGPPKQRAASAN